MNVDVKVGKALVIGGGMAGLLAARVLAEHYAEVLVVERDKLPEGPQNRPGTPQAHQPHRLLPRGDMILNTLFPGYTEDLLAQGAFLQEGKSIQLINQFGEIKVNEERDAGYSRPMFEWIFRQRVQQLSNVRFLCNQEVLGLQSTSDHARVTGVHLRERGQMGPQRTLAADLVVDASGRSSKLLKWLHELGYEMPEAERLKVSLGYSTRHYQIPAHLDQWSVILLEGKPANGIATGVMSQIENHIAEVTLYCAGGERYPTTEGELYEQEVAQLLCPAIAEWVQHFEPLGEPRGYRVPECVRNHFELAERWPAGLLALGDSICNFDPIYGQGMTVAAIEAEILGNCVREQQANPQPNFERSVFIRMQNAIEPAWWLSAIADLRWPGVEYVGPQPLQGVAFVQRFLDLLLQQAYGQHNMMLFERYFMMTGLLISPRDLFNAEIVNMVLAADASAEAEQLRADFLRGKGQSLEQILDQLIPAFTDVAMPFSMVHA